MKHWMRGVVIQPDGTISVEQVQADLVMPQL